MNTIIITALSLGLLAFAMGVMLYYASIFFYVEEDPLIEEVNEILPQANCGACGVPGCLNFAEKLVKTRDMGLFCPVGGNDLALDIASLMGLEAVERSKMVARVMCQGGDHATRTGEYKGIKSCKAVAIARQNDFTCSYACLGYGDCVAVCDFDSIHIINGVAIVNEEKCTACNDCIIECPINIIELQPYDKTVFIACRSLDPGGPVRKYCSVGCTGCKLCVKACTFEAIHFDNNLAAIIPEKCTNCNDCVTECDTNTIVVSLKGMAEIKESIKSNEKVAL